MRPPLICALIPVLAFGLGAQAASLKPFAEVTGAVVHLSDLVEGADGAEDVVVRAAPEPGREVSVSASAVVRLALAHGIDMDPASLTRIRIARAGKPISPQLIADKMTEELLSAGLTGDFDVQLGNQRLAIYMPVEESYADIALEHVMVNERSGRFTATLVYPMGDGRVGRASVAGLAQQMTEVPVLGERLDLGDIVSETDIQWIRVPERTVRRTMVTDMDELVGLSLKRRISPGRPIRMTDLEKPRMIERGQLIAMIVRRGPMTLTATGRAMQSGGKGEWIRVQNTETHRLVEGRVIGPNEVEVGVGPTRTAAR